MTGTDPKDPLLAPVGLVKRSILPIAALVLLLSTLLIGPYGFLVATLAWWQIVRRIH